MALNHEAVWPGSFPRFQATLALTAPAGKLTIVSTRLLSPLGRRLYPNPLTGRVTHARVDPAHLGIPIPTATMQTMLASVDADAHAMTWQTLKQSGWVEYDGPAQTDAYGYVVPSTDPSIVVQAPIIMPIRNHPLSKYDPRKDPNR
jgi:hypothetical protein